MLTRPGKLCHVDSHFEILKLWCKTLHILAGRISCASFIGHSHSPLWLGYNKTWLVTAPLSAVILATCCATCQLSVIHRMRVLHSCLQTFCFAVSDRQKGTEEKKKFWNGQLPDFCSSSTFVKTATAVLLVVLYKCETWSLALKEGHGLRVGAGCREECVDLRDRKWQKTAQKSTVTSLTFCASQQMLLERSNKGA
jgi:hypothetical protein